MRSAKFENQQSNGIKCIKVVPSTKWSKSGRATRSLIWFSLGFFCRFTGRPGDYNTLFGARQEEVRKFIVIKNPARIHKSITDFKLV